MALLPAYRLKLYRNFKAIESADYYGVVRYYERFEDDIRSLDFEEYFDCTVTYANALFEVGEHGKHIVMADHLLETVIMENVETWGGEDIYAKLLFKKAASFFNLEDYPRAEHILRELVKLAPWDRLRVRFLRTCLLRQRPAWMPRIRAIALLFILLSAASVALEIFVIRPFFPALLTATQYAYFVFFAVGILVLAIGETWHGWHCLRETESFACLWQKRKSAA